jgi:hypothetical protein
MTKIGKKFIKQNFTANGFPKAEERVIGPPLSLVPSVLTKEQQELVKAKKWKIRTIPDKEDSPTATISVRILTGLEPLRATIQGVKEIMAALTGLNLHAPDTMIPVIKLQIEGSALAAFETSIHEFNDNNAIKIQIAVEAVAATPAGTRVARQTAARTTATAANKLTEENVLKALKEIIVAAAGYKAWTKQVRYMKNLKKPEHMKLRTFLHHVLRLNQEELPWLPPFHPTPKAYIPPDDIRTIIQNSVPEEWKREMDRQNFDIDSGTLIDVVQFCERVEGNIPYSIPKKVKFNNGTNQPDHSKQGKGTASKNGNWCPYHQTSGHDASDCKVLINDPEAKPQWKAKTTNDWKTKNGNNKQPWKNKAKEGQTFTKAELHALIAKTKASSIKEYKDKQSANEKRKRNKKGESEGEGFMMDTQGANVTNPKEEGEIQEPAHDDTDLLLAITTYENQFEPSSASELDEILENYQAMEEETVASVTTDISV